MHGPWWFRSGTMRHRNIYLYFMQKVGERLYEIAKMGQHEYDAADELYNMKPSIANPMWIFLASLAKSVSKLSRAFHASLLDECNIIWSFSCTPYLCHLMCLVVFFEINKHFIRGVRHMHWSCLWATSIITFSPSSFITSMNLDLPHFRHFVSFLCSL
jgi:hypothetical protein